MLSFRTKPKFRPKLNFGSSLIWLEDFEIVKAAGDKSFSPVMVGQKGQRKNLEKYVKVKQVEDWQTANTPFFLGLEKQRHSKGDTIPATHTVYSVALA